MRIKTGLFLSVLAFPLFLARPAAAGDCKDASELAAKLVEGASKVCEKVDGKWKKCDAKKLANAVSEIDYWVKFWNNVVGNTAAHLGPRQLSFNAQDKGTILNPGVRTWISVGPSAGKATVDIKGLGGKAGLKVSYCAVNAEGRVDFLGMQEVGSGKSPAAKDLSEAEVGGKFIVVKLDGTEGMGKKYEYNINLAGTLVQ